jgi:hypothetical protein
MRSLLTVLLVVLTLPSAAQTLEPASFERILLPISFTGEIPGAFGTRWSTLILMFNDSEEPIQFLGSVCPEGDPAQCQPAQTLHPRADVEIESPPSPSQGAFLHITRAAAARVPLTATLYDRSRAEENAGTELPVVRESDFHHRIVLPLVLLRGPFRTALRVYSHDETPGTARLRMYRLDRLDPFVDETIELSGIVHVQADPFPTQPAYFHVFDLIARWPVLEAAASVRVELDSEREIWAFASQTNNVTQLVTTVRPQ